ncbi:MAG: c-type cytochrome, partial [Chthoniobacterales bacterium]
FKGEKEEFVAGRPLPLTDAIIHPKDGAMYFAIGGRKTQSALYRVTYVGPESTAPAAPYTMTAEGKLRHELEKLHENGTGPEAIAKAWPYLGHADRLVRFAARVAIERQPVEKWAAQALAEKNPQAAIEALIALSCVGRSEAAEAAAKVAQKKSGVSSGPVHKTPSEDVELQKKVIDALGKLDFKTIAPNLKQPLLRAWQLCFTRFGKPDAATCAAVAAKFDPVYPDADPLMNRELVQLLVFVDSTSVVAKTVPVLATVRDVAEDIATDSLLARNEGYATAARTMQASRPNRQAMDLAYILRNATAGWTPALRKSYFAWFPSTRGWKGGNSFNGFLNNIRTEALANFVPEAERPELDAMSKKPAAALSVGTMQPKGPGRAWTTDDMVKLVAGGLKGRNFERGKGMYAATLCAACHKFAGDGGNVGPDLTGTGNRYTIRDLAENILEPSKVISDQYGSEELHTKDGNLIIGRVVAEEAGKLMVMTSPLTPADLTPVPVADVKERKVWNTSMMPPGLINSLNEEELKDLIAYLMSGGNANDKAFAK